MQKIPSAFFNELNRYIHKNLEYYSELNNKDKIEFNQFIKSLNKKYEITLDFNKVIEMRNVYIYLLSKRKGIIANRYGEKIITEYNASHNIVEIANKYNLPPMSILYQILIEQKNESHNIKKIIKRRMYPEIILKQMPLIEKLDPGHWFINKKFNLPSIVKKINVKCIYGIKRSPKIKIIDPFLINDDLITWVDVKPYILFDNIISLVDANKTYNKYQHMGMGLILYSDIICSSAFIKKIKANINVF
jgi:hypothetical protein